MQPRRLQALGAFLILVSVVALVMTELLRLPKGVPHLDRKYSVPCLILLLALGIHSYVTGKDRGAGSLLPGSEPERSRIKGFVFQFAGVLLMAFALGLFLFVSLAQGRAVSSLDWVLLIMTLGMAFGVGTMAYHTGKGLGALPAEAVLSSDPRPPILYLRSFLADEPTLQTPRSSSSVFGLGLEMATEEEQLVEVLKPIGPLVAIGKPGESIAVPGAARLYLSDAEWQSKVLDLMSRAQLVVLRAGPTPGFWWELQTALQTVPPERILLLLLDFDRTEYQAFQQEAARHLRFPLPDPESSVPRLIHFQGDWTPQAEILAPRLLGLPAWRQALAPVMKKLGLVLKRSYGFYLRPDKVAAYLLGLLLIWYLGLAIARRL